MNTSLRFIERYLATSIPLQYNFVTSQQQDTALWSFDFKGKYLQYVSTDEKINFWCKTACMPQKFVMMHVATRVVKLLLCAYYYYYYYYFIDWNCLLLLLLLLRHIFKHPITITITITRNIKHAYYYYYYFPDYYYYYYFPITITLLLLLSQRNTTQADYKVIFKGLYYLHCITHYHRHIIIDNIILKLSWKFCGSNSQ